MPNLGLDTARSQYTSKSCRKILLLSGIRPGKACQRWAMAATLLWTQMHKPIVVALRQLPLLSCSQCAKTRRFDCEYVSKPDHKSQIVATIWRPGNCDSIAVRDLLWKLSLKTMAWRNSCYFGSILSFQWMESGRPPSLKQKIIKLHRSPQCSFTTLEPWKVDICWIVVAWIDRWSAYRNSILKWTSTTRDTGGLLGCCLVSWGSQRISKNLKMRGN